MNTINRIKITQSHLYFAIYVAISLATFRHSMLGFSSLEGSLFWSGVSAIAIDMLMILFAHSIRSHDMKRDWKSLALFVGMSVTSLASIGTQLLYAVTEAQLLEVAPGATWLGQRAVDIINMRVVVLPMLLPVLAIIAALFGESKREQTVSAEMYAALDEQLDKARLEAADLRRAGRGNAAQIETQGRLISELQEFHRTVTDPANWKDATAITRLVGGTIFTNGNMPKTKVLAKLTGVGDATINSAIRSLKDDSG